MRPNWLYRLINYLRGRDPVAEYYAWLRRFGRIAEARITDAQQDETGTTIFYTYKIANVDYETSQKLTPEQAEEWNKYKLGRSISIRYDPRKPGSSILL